MGTALLVIDVQRALSEGEYAAFDVTKLVERINGVIAKARAAGIPVVFIQHEEGEGPMVHGRPGWELAPALDARPGDPRIRKTKPDSFAGTGLQALLEKLGVKDLVVTGMQSDFCVDATTRGALAQGYAVTLVSDGHSTLDNEGRKAADISRLCNESLAALARVELRMAADVAFPPA